MRVSPSLVASMLLLAASAHARAPGPSAKPRLGAEPSCRSERDCEPEELVVRPAPAAVSTELLAASKRGSFWWAVLANWLSFFALGLSIPVLGRVIATLVNEDGSPDVSPASAVLSGDSLDKLITFLFVGFHGALSDVAYVADVSPPERRAINLGIFQGVSAPSSSASRSLRSSTQSVLNFVVIALLARTKTRLDLRAANPIGARALRRLFCSTPLLRRSAAAFALLWLGNMCINSQFGNYANHLFKWGPQDSAPILVLIGLMIGVAPAALIPRLGLRTSMQTGGAVYAVGLLAIAFARTPAALRGALLGALETLQDLCDTLAFSGYGRLFAASIEPPAKLPGAVFLVAAALLSAFLATVQSAFRAFPAASAAFLAS
ncbi:hypothetical protein EMIHUDRAFT_223212 [Emiliania huxleyi CCMP1516]|uniref:Solute carrier family 40 protein n=2 Tax=Emiliania huxleyi TaxID=2903 RepID=A0A0D3KW57_EMIH1|nr:hypothetical protein EMIHUDRAFT_223212 [Emiliania huxleyi CCMP1516]EOD39992.1 hypothetical protein EMIHUDRAFT_223212 [Emiliania huxleyi CCMP1516]|eukprot:XP_005792421.1 hypothetical protein EMIHUDRAFT_223212 [Emiliania huxleyi CCMP1516]